MTCWRVTLCHTAREVWPTIRSLLEAYTQLLKALALRLARPRTNDLYDLQCRRFLLDKAQEKGRDRNGRTSRMNMKEHDDEGWCCLVLKRIICALAALASPVPFLQHQTSRARKCTRYLYRRWVEPRVLRPSKPSPQGLPKPVWAHPGGANDEVLSCLASGFSSSIEPIRAFFSSLVGDPDILTLIIPKRHPMWPHG